MKRINGMNAGFTVWLLLSAFTWVAGADRTKYYEIAGASAIELREALNRLRPVGRDGKPHDGVTSWDVRWRYKTANSQAGCAVTSFEVSLEIVMTVPKWTNEADAPSSLVQRWRDSYAALLVHEDGHKTLAVAAAAAIRDAGTKVSSQPSCSEVARVLDRVSSGLLDQYRQKEQQYDTETEHGRTQGARFP